MRSHRGFTFVASAAVLLLLLGGRQGEAQGSTDWVAVKGMDERFRLDLGGFFQSFTTTVRVGAAYDYMDISVEKQADRTADFDYQYDGPMVYLSLVF